MNQVVRHSIFYNFPEKTHYEHQKKRVMGINSVKRDLISSTVKMIMKPAIVCKV